MWKRPVPKPAFVEIGLFAVKTRMDALIYFWICAGGALITFPLCVYLLSFFLNESLITGICVGLFCSSFLGAAALWYWVCIRWMDHNKQW
jgi:hypothetical protein